MEIWEFFGGEYVGGYVFLLEGIYDICYIFLICVFGGVFYGRGWFEMYGFVIGMRLMFINEVFQCYYIEVFLEYKNFYIVYMQYNNSYV